MSIVHSKYTVYRQTVNRIVQLSNEEKAAVEVQERAVRLTSGVSDILGGYEGVVSQAGTNLQNLAGEAQVALPALLQAIGTELPGYGDLIGTRVVGCRDEFTKRARWRLVRRGRRLRLRTARRNRDA
jgi:hypothetical protein